MSGCGAVHGAIALRKIAENNDAAGLYIHTADNKHMVADPLIAHK